MDERAKQILGRRVEETRRDLGISKVDFCVATGISRPYLDRIEDGTANFTLKVLFKIAPALGMTVSELLEGIEWGVPPLLFDALWAGPPGCDVQNREYSAPVRL